MAQKLTFSQFGTEFVRLALTEKVLYDSIGPELAKQQMPAIDEHTGPAHVTGRAQMRLNQLSVKRRDDASIADQNVVFDVSFGIHLTLYIKVAVAQENYEVDAGVVLRFIAETWRSPLSFNVHARSWNRDQGEFSRRGQLGRSRQTVCRLGSVRQGGAGEAAERCITDASYHQCRGYDHAFTPAGLSSALRMRAERSAVRGGHR